MRRTMAERLKKLAEILSQKAEEIRIKTQGVDVDGSRSKNTTKSRQNQK